MAEKQVMISVPERLRDWLRQEAQRLEDAWERRTYQTPHYNETPANPTRPHVSIAAVIEVMLEARLKQRQRLRRHRAGRRKKGGPA